MGPESISNMGVALNSGKYVFIHTLNDSMVSGLQFRKYLACEWVKYLRDANFSKHSFNKICLSVSQLPKKFNQNVKFWVIVNSKLRILKEMILFFNISSSSGAILFSNISSFNLRLIDRK